MNRYAYVNGNPITYTDTFGMAREVVTADGSSWLHNLFFAASFVTALGNFADAADALLYLAEGNYEEAGISALATLPVVGVLDTQTRVAQKVVGKINDYRETVKKGVIRVKESKIWRGQRGSIKLPDPRHVQEIDKLFKNTPVGKINDVKARKKHIRDILDSYNNEKFGLHGKLKRNKNVDGQSYHLNQLCLVS